MPFIKLSAVFAKPRYIRFTNPSEIFLSVLYLQVADRRYSSCATEAQEESMEKLETLALTESETARMLSISISGLRKWRRNGSGPRFVRLGRLVRYLGTDVQSWLDQNAFEPAQKQTSREM